MNKRTLAIVMLTGLGSVTTACQNRAKEQPVVRENRENKNITPTATVERQLDRLQEERDIFIKDTESRLERCEERVDDFGDRAEKAAKAGNVELRKQYGTLKGTYAAAEAALNNIKNTEVSQFPMLKERALKEVNELERQLESMSTPVKGTTKPIHTERTRH